MARGRMIDKRVSNSKKIGMVSDKAKILWFMIYPHLDKEGRIAFDDLEDLQDEIIPKFKGWTPKKIGLCLNELANIGLIYLYPNKNKIAIQYTRFEDFQIGLRKEREAPSKIDAPDEAPENSGVFRISPALRLNKSNEGKKEGILFNFETRQFQGISNEDISGWQEAYPACVINIELMKMREWLLANPAKKKINYRRFIVNWLAKGQDQGGTKKWEAEQERGKQTGSSPSKPKSPEQQKFDEAMKARRKEVVAKYQSRLDEARKKKDSAMWEEIQNQIGLDMAAYSRELGGEG